MSQSLWHRGVKVVFALAVAVIVAVLGWAVLSLPPEAEGLAPAVEAHRALSGVENPVTAVLLNFRAYDTLLEIAVLVLAGLGARALVGGERVQAQTTTEPVSPLLMGFLRLVAPVMVVVVGYLLWVGAYVPGGAFQAGALLGALGVLLLVSNVRWTRRIPDFLERTAVAVGLALFVIGGMAVMSAESRFLAFRPPTAKWLILAIEAACVLTIGAVLCQLFAGGRLQAASEAPASTEDNGRS